MTNIVLAKVIFFYSLMAPASQVICEGVLNYSKNGSKLVMLKGVVVKENEDPRHWTTQVATITVDVSQNFTTKYEKANNNHLQTFYPSSCLGVK